MNVGAFHSEDIRRMVKAMWERGDSQRAIAACIGKNKNVVAGMVHRMGLPPRSKKPTGWTAKRIKDAKPKPKPAPDPIGPLNDFPPKGTCQYTADHPGTGTDWRMCGHPGFPWCEHHAQTCTSQRKTGHTL